MKMSLHKTKTQDKEEDSEELMEKLVERACNHVSQEESIRLSKSAWLAGQFLGEICDYEPGTKLLQYVSCVTNTISSNITRFTSQS